MTQPRDEAMRVWERAHGAAYDRRPLDHQAAATVIQQALDDQVARIVAHLDAMKRDDTNWPQVIARIIERGEWRST